MKNQLAKVIGASALAAGALSLSAIAASAGTLVGIYDGNDDKNPIEYQGTTYDFFGKYEVEESKFEGTEFIINLESKGKEVKQGTAEVQSGGAGLYAVKAGNGYALYYTEDLSEFNWDTSDRDKKGLSHLSVWRAPVDSTPAYTSVPEPASLLGFIAIGAVVAGSKLKKKATGN